MGTLAKVCFLNARSELNFLNGKVDFWHLGPKCHFFVNFLSIFVNLCQFFLLHILSTFLDQKMKVRSVSKSDGSCDSGGIIFFCHTISESGEHLMFIPTI